MESELSANVSRKHLKVYFWLAFSLALPFAITMLTVREPLTPPPYDSNPSPLGYWKSLSIFLVPILIFLIWLLRKKKSVETKSFFFTILGILTLGSILDFGFGYHFFQFPNKNAVIGVYLPAFDWNSFAFEPSYLPIEEFLFYFLGGTYMLCSYLWGVLYWFKRYNHFDHAAVAKNFPKLMQFSPRLLILGVGLIALGFVIKHISNHPEGFPGYYVFLVIAAFIPIVFCYNIVSYLINWRAFTFMSFTLIMVSIVYEATLGFPYGWWKYQTDYMLGVFITPWHRLPIEAVLLWVASAFGTVLLFEFLRAWFHSERKLTNVMFGGNHVYTASQTKPTDPKIKNHPGRYLSNEFGFPVPRGPYTNTVGHLTNFLITGNTDNIKKTCDKYLNFDQEAQFVYKPFSPLLIATFAFLQGYVNREDGVAIGQLPENDLVFWIPTIAWNQSFGIPIPSHIAMFPYRLYVDSPYGLCSGREALGLFKNFAKFEGTPNPNHPYFSMQVLGFENPDPTKIGGYYNFIECKPTNISGNLSTTQASSSIWQDVINTFKSEVNQNEKNSPKILELLSNWIQPSIKCVSVKQFRDISNPDFACYQHRVEVESEVTNFKNAIIFGGEYHLDFHTIYSETLVNDLGIKLNYEDSLSKQVGSAKSLLTFWADATFNMGSGKVV